MSFLERRRATADPRSSIRRPCGAAPAISPWKYSTCSHVIARPDAVCSILHSPERERARAPALLARPAMIVAKRTSAHNSGTRRTDRAQPRAIPSRRRPIYRARCVIASQADASRAYITLSPAFHALMIMTRESPDAKDRVAARASEFRGVGKIYRDRSRGSTRSHDDFAPPPVHSRRRGGGEGGEGLRPARLRSRGFAT